LNSPKQLAVRTLRTFGLLTLTERVRYLLAATKQRRGNKVFSAANPDFKVPPEALSYDAYSVRDLNFYKNTGIETTAFLAQVARRYFPNGYPLRILEWGCGPARVIRHIPEAFGSGVEVYGSDYNQKTISWCAENIPGVRFVENGLEPPLPFASGFFDFIYSISVFTHLSEPVSIAWIEELTRITHSGSVLVITTQGDAFLGKLMPDEVDIYRSRGIVVRGNVAEGSRIFAAFHSKEYLTKHLFKNLEVVEFLPGQNLDQDQWILRKP
jgi:SAM-dependent methyltransferase